jgi:acetyl-CoA carboxylase carboxyltransferase component
MVTVNCQAAVNQLFDEGETALEYGASTAPRTPGLELDRDGVLSASGLVNGVPTVVIGFEGTHGLYGHAKVEKAIALASELGAPVVLVGAGGAPRESEGPYYGERREALNDLAQLSGRVPLVAVALGQVQSSRALMFALCDAVIGTPAASFDLGTGFDPPDETPATTFAKAGVVDVVVEDETAAIAAARRYLELFSVPQREDWHGADDVADRLAEIVPENPRRAFDARKLVELVADEGTMLFLRGQFGGAIITALARVGGRAVGVLATNPMIGAGAIDSPASDKMTRFITQCDTFGLPVVFLADTPGLLAGPKAEQAGLVRHSTRPFFVETFCRVPFYSIIVRRAYGQGMVVMATLATRPKVPAYTATWPLGQFGGMGLGGAAAITSASSARSAEDERSQEDLEAELRVFGSPLGRARRYDTDEVIEPGLTRERLVAAVRQAPLYDVRRPRWPIDAW